MNEQLARQVADEVLRRIDAAAPAALLVGDAPPETLGYRLTDRSPYEAVIVGSLDAGALLSFSAPAVWAALLEGKPVYLWEGGLRHRACAAAAGRALWARLSAAEREWQRLGVRFYGGAAARRLVTAEEARRLLGQGRTPPADAVLTPLAREVLAGGRS